MKNKILASMPEEESETMKGPKKKMCDWRHKRRDCWKEFKFKHPLRACSLQYGGLALFVLLVGHILSGILSGMANVDYFRYPLSETFRHPFNLSANLTINRTPNMQGTEIYAAEMYADNARSILCTLVGSEAAIVAIVVSLTLIAIEFTASEYSPRVIDISLKNPDMWFLLGIYGVAIFSSIILLKQLPYESRFPTEDVSFAFWFGLFSYVALLPYLRNTIRLFDPTHIVKRVSADIEKDKLLKYIKDLNETSKKDETDGAKENSMTNGDTEGHEENPIQPILDIVYRSINKYDLETVRNGLEQIVTLAEKVIVAYSQDNAQGKDNEKLLKKQMRFSNHFCDPLRRISRLAASKDDEESTREVIKTLQTIGKKTADEELNAATAQVAVALGDVGKFSAEKGKAFEDAVSEVAKSLGEVGKTAAKKKLNEAVKLVASTLGDVGAIYAEKEKDLEAAVTQIASSLGAVGKMAAKNGKNFDLATNEVAKVLGRVGVSAARSELQNAAKDAVKNLLDIEREAKANELEYTPLAVVISLEEVGEEAANNNLEYATLDAVSAFFSLIDEKFEFLMRQIARALQVVGNVTIKKSNLKDSTKVAVCSLIRLKNVAEENNLKEAQNDAETYISEWSKSNSKTVQNAIDKCK
jgi:lipid-A-disaccharide synthase-like uncharacterized protein